MLMLVVTQITEYIEMNEEDVEAFVEAENDFDADGIGRQVMYVQDADVTTNKIFYMA